MKDCRVADTDEFLKVMFPVEETLVDAIWEKVKGTHHPQSRWSAFPESGVKEGEEFGAFVSVANAIHSAAEGLCSRHPSGNSARLGGSTITQKLRILSIRILHAYDRVVSLHIVCYMTVSRIHRHLQYIKHDDGEGVAWWLQIVAALETKRSDEERWEVVVKRLIGYLRQILRDQLDRRFVFGFTVGTRCMSVCLHDRSGVLLTSTPIDIHKFPKQFIRIVASFAVLAPHKLGFDSSMKIYVQPNEVVESYRLTSKTALDVFATDSYKKRWVITLNDGTQYLTVKSVSVERARVMLGRATLVWAVVPFIHGRPGTEVFVLKQSWRPESVASEGELYNKAKGSDCEFLGRITQYEDAVIDDMVDRTGSFIRGGLSENLPPCDQQERATKHQGPVLFNNDEIDPITSPRNVSCVHTRVIMSTFGWPLKEFATLRELLLVFSNGVQGHEYLYDNGLLHRDISAGNIIIAWCPGEGATTPFDTKGCLIDLDRSKLGAPNFRSLPQVENQSDPLPEEDRIMLSSYIRICFQYRKDSLLSLSVHPDIISAAHGISRQKSTDYAIAAIKYSLAFPPAQENHIITTDRLGWHRVERRFDFNPAVIALNVKEKDTPDYKELRTGTPPYASAEVLGRFPLKYGEVALAAPYQDAIHDIESFLWILVNICLTRSGPGGARRAELTDEGPDHSVLREVVYHVFESDDATIALNKRHLFATPSDFEQDVIGNFHPYFHPLQPLVRQWFWLLRLAYAHRESYEYHTLHQRVIAMLNETIATVPAEEDEVIVAKILEKRHKDLNDLCSPSDISSEPIAAHLDSSPTATISKTRPQHSPPRSPSPSGSAHKRARHK